jgi:hypothetical protein
VGILTAPRQRGGTFFAQIPYPPGNVLEAVFSPVIENKFTKVYDSDTSQFIIVKQEMPCLISYCTSI